MFYRLLTAYLRRQNRRLMSFAEAPPDAALPDPPPAPCLLYLHVPFCEVLCPFCPFHRVEFHHQRAARYFRALQAEICSVGERGFRFDEVYVGGFARYGFESRSCR